MGRDSRLLEAAEAGEAGARVYDWSEPWVTLGRFQSPERVLVRGANVPWIVRPTGGKAVLHGHDITIGLTLPLAEPTRLAHAYRIAIAPIISAMRSCGLPAALAENTPYSKRGPRTADCFSHVSPNDVVDERTGQKICGCALRLTKHAVLLQASIPVRRPTLDPADVIVGAKQLTAPSWRHPDFADALREALRTQPASHPLIRSSGNGG